MRVVCPYTELHPLAESGLERHAVLAELIQLGGGQDEYHKLLLELWEDGESFLIVEHDVEIHESVVPELETCPEPWCLFAYGAPSPAHPITRGLGCTRFHRDLLEAVPDAVGRIRHEWQYQDSELNGILGQAGYEPHLHTPPVLHHHFYPQHGCACGIAWRHE